MATDGVKHYTCLNNKKYFYFLYTLRTCGTFTDKNRQAFRSVSVMSNDNKNIPLINYKFTTVSRPIEMHRHRKLYRNLKILSI